MSTFEDLSCIGCSKICTGYTSTYSLKGRLVCQNCYDSFQSESPATLSGTDLTQIKEKSLGASCHPESGAYYLLKPTCYLLCYDCKNYINSDFVNISCTKSQLKILVRENLAKDADEYLKYRWKKTLRLNPTSIKLYECLLNYSFCSLDYAICSVHLQPANSYNYCRFIFLCEYCDQADSVPINSYENINYLINICLATLKSFPTDSLNSALISNLREIKNKTISSENYQFAKNFLYLMKFALDDKDSKKINIDSSCVSCGNFFGFGMMHPVQLHEELRHEVCMSCFINKRFSTCPIDDEPVTGRFISANMSEVSLKLKSLKKCCHCQVLYNKKSDMVPYEFCCNENLCVDFNKECQNCSDSFRKNDLIKNERLSKLLSFLQVTCPLHDETVDLFHKNDFKVMYCKKCSNYSKIANQRARFFEDPLSFSNLLKENLNNLNNHSLIFHVVKTIFDFIPVQRIYEIISKELENPMSVERFLRFDKILPYSNTRVYRWEVVNSFRESFYISVKGVIELHGLIIGNCEDGELIADVYINDYYLKSYSIDRLNSSSFTTDVLFDNSLVLTFDKVKIGVAFRGQGKYLAHGRPNQNIQLIFKGTEICLSNEGIDSENGDNVIGGPIIGFILNAQTLNEEEENLSRFISSFNS